jgi:hypothetical protein
VGGGLGVQGLGSGPGSPGPYGPGGWRTASLARSSRGGVAAAADALQAVDGSTSREDRDSKTSGGPLEAALAAGSSAAGSPLAGAYMATPPQLGGAGGGSGGAAGRGAAGVSSRSLEAGGAGGLRDGPRDWERELDRDRDWDKDRDQQPPFDRPHFWPGPPSMLQTAACLRSLLWQPCALLCCGSCYCGCLLWRLLNSGRDDMTVQQG